MANPIVTFEMQDGGKIVAELYFCLCGKAVIPSRKITEIKHDKRNTVFLSILIHMCMTV